MFNKFQKFFVTMLLISICTLLVSCNGARQASATESRVYLNANEIKIMYTDPNKFKGRYVKLSGKIFNDIEYDEDVVYFQMWSNPEKNENNTIVSYKGSIPDIKSDSYVKIEGKITGTFKGKNASGAEFKAPQIVADNVEISSYKDIVNP